VKFANVVSLIALFVALGGGAYAVNLDKNDVKSNNIKDGQVKGVDLKNGGIKGQDVQGGAIGSSHLSANSVDGEAVVDGSLTNDDVDVGSFSFSSIPTAGVLSSQARDIGGDGDTAFGPVSGRAAAATALEDVQMAVPDPTLFGDLSVFLSEPLAAGESRTFTVVERVTAFGSILETEISCTVGANQSNCFDSGIEGSGALMLGIRIESTGAGLDPADDAYVALSAKTESP
jgi:hypothetical protein